LEQFVSRQVRSCHRPALNATEALCRKLLDKSLVVRVDNQNALFREDETQFEVTVRVENCVKEVVAREVASADDLEVARNGRLERLERPEPLVAPVHGAELADLAQAFA
jgi:hypothetical protein